MIFQENAGQRGDGPPLPTATEPGDPQAAEDLLPLVYQELRRLAAYKMAHEPPGQTLQLAALAHVWYYVGLTLAEAAEVLGVSEPTAKRHWAYAQAWLFRELEASA